MIFLPVQLLLCCCNNLVRFEPELSLQFLERRGSAESLHTNDVPRGADVSLPSQGGGLLHGDARLHVRRQHTVSILLGLMLENFPGWHRYDPRADAFGEQLLVGLDRQADFTARGDEDYFGVSTRRIGRRVSQYIGAMRDTR